MTTITQGHFSVTFIDQSGKSSVQRLASITLTALNFNAQAAAAGLLLADTVVLSKGTLTKSLLGNLQSTTNPALPAAPASRSNKFAVTYIDTTSGDTYTTQVPVADPSAVTFLAGTRLVDLGVAPASTYKTDFEAFVQSEEGHSVTIKQMRWVGRHI